MPGDDALAGIEQLSARRELIGVHRPGGFATLVRVPVGRLRALPDGADPRLGVLAEPLANGVHAARIGRAGVEGGPVDRAVVLGAGTIGLMALQAAILAGAAGPRWSSRTPSAARPPPRSARDVVLRRRGGRRRRRRRVRRASASRAPAGSRSRCCARAAARC